MMAARATQYQIFCWLSVETVTAELCSIDCVVSGEHKVAGGCDP